jgi:hypothetical protein
MIERPSAPRDAGRRAWLLVRRADLPAALAVARQRSTSRGTPGARPAREPTGPRWQRWRPPCQVEASARETAGRPRVFRRPGAHRRAGSARLPVARGEEPDPTRAAPRSLPGHWPRDAEDMFAVLPRHRFAMPRVPRPSAGGQNGSLVVRSSPVRRAYARHPRGEPSSPARGHVAEATHARPGAGSPARRYPAGPPGRRRPAHPCGSQPPRPRQPPSMAATPAPGPRSPPGQARPPRGQRPSARPHRTPETHCLPRINRLPGTPRPATVP